VQNGLLVRRQGAGTFVAQAAAPTRRLDHLKSFTEEIESAGGHLTTRLLACDVEPASTEVAVLLALEASADVVRVARLRTIDRVPTTVMTSWLAHARVAGLEHIGLPDGSLYAALREHFGLVPRRAVQRVSAVAADGTRAALLGVEPGAPTLYIERVTYDERERPFEFARSWSRPGFELSVDLES
jgi:GntR family transcriptional regulator